MQIIIKLVLQLLEQVEKYFYLDLKYIFAVVLGAAGLTTGEAGFLAYYEICNRLQQQGWKKVYDNELKSNYAYKGEEWVGFDDVYSLALKVCSIEYREEKKRPRDFICSYLD